VLLFDASAFLYRYHFALSQRLTAHDGTDTTVLHSFLKLVLGAALGRDSNLRAHSAAECSAYTAASAAAAPRLFPQRLVVVFDGGAQEPGTAAPWRRELFPDYKARC